MTKTELIAAIAEATELSKADVKSVLESFESTVIKSCQKGEPVNMTGFAKFARVDRAARMGRNPATGESIKIKAKSVAKITPLKGFKDAVLASKKSKKK